MGEEKVEKPRKTNDPGGVVIDLLLRCLYTIAYVADHLHLQRLAEVFCRVKLNKINARFVEGRGRGSNELLKGDTNVDFAGKGASVTRALKPEATEKLNDRTLER